MNGRPEMLETADAGPDESHFGLCPTCRRTDGYLNVGREHWFVCDAHRVKWLAGENLFSSWKRETPEEWAENRNRLNGYAEVIPERCPEEAEEGPPA